MSYNCENCNYSTNDSGNFTRHKKTKKHIKIFEEKDIIVTNNKEKLTHNNTNLTSMLTRLDSNEIICNICGFETIHKSSMSRHKKSCKQKENNDNKLLDKIENLEKEFKYKLEIVEKEKEMAEREKELYQKLEKEKSEMLNTFMANANNLLNKTVDNNKVTTDALKSVSMSALKYANEKFQNTPALLPLDNFNLNDLDFDDEEDKKKLVEILIYNAKQNSLDKLLGDHIVKEYKKDNPEDQVFHTTDCSRLNYIVRELMETALIWSTDKSGIKICTSIIKPLIKKCINALLEHQKYLLQEMGRGEYQVQKDVEIIINVLMTIESGNLETEINKYIAPFFNLDKK